MTPAVTAPASFTGEFLAKVVADGSREGGVGEGMGWMARGGGGEWSVGTGLGRAGMGLLVLGGKTEEGRCELC